jgi:hypothetical protein
MSNRTRPSRGVLLLSLVCLGVAPALAAEDPLTDWSDWEKYRASVKHPSLTVKEADQERAKENARRYPWAKAYVEQVRKGADAAVERLKDEHFVEHMIEATTPQDGLFTPCPACRDQKKPYVPHGEWDWTVERPDEIQCKNCKTVFPNAKYPETVELKTRSGQRLTFYGGDTFEVFAYPKCRPSFTGNIRARKVGYTGGLAKVLGEAYALTGDVRYAQGARRILLRLAEVYPGYLIHVGYGEYADMDPRVAAPNINSALPADELCYPPNKPDRKLVTGYWTAGRATGVGQEGRSLLAWAHTYDWTCEAKDAAGRPVYSDDDRRKIERDLLLESTILFTADKQINNKSVTNRNGTAMVGMALGHPGLVRYGMEGFTKTIDEWFLPDGGTPESPAYAMMALNGIDELGQAFRGYTDPVGYADANGKRLENVDLYHGTHYARVWEAMFKGLRGDLLYPAFADSHRTTAIGKYFPELLVANYPEKPEYLALLKEVCGPNLADVDASVATYYRAPGLETKPAAKLVLQDNCLPDLRVGYMRTGDDGRESLLLLSASHWGTHHHRDSLNVSYWKQGRELLSDLGYLWDHPKKTMNARTLAHNLVMVDEAEQQTTDRGGDVAFFRSGQHVKAMRASSKAYPGAGVYERTSILVDHGGGRSYAADVFRVDGGKKQDYVFHAPTASAEVSGVSIQPLGERVYDLANVRGGRGDGVWTLKGKIDGDMTFTAWNVPAAGERVFIGDGWGQRDFHNTDIGATFPYVIRRTEGSGERLFVSVFEGHAPNDPVVRSVARTPIDGGVLIRVDRKDGKDYIVCRTTDARTSIPTTAGSVDVAGRVAVIRCTGKTVDWADGGGGGGGAPHQGTTAPTAVGQR